MNYHLISLIALLAIPILSSANPRPIRGVLPPELQEIFEAAEKKVPQATPKVSKTTVIQPKSAITPAQQVALTPAPTPAALPAAQDETAAIVLQTWAGLAGTIISIAKNPDDPAAVANNIGQLFAGFANIIGQIVKRNKPNNFAYLLAALENPDYQEWLTQVITQKV